MDLLKKMRQASISGVGSTTRPFLGLDANSDLSVDKAEWIIL